MDQQGRQGGGNQPAGRRPAITAANSPLRARRNGRRRRTGRPRIGRWRSGRRIVTPLVSSLEQAAGVGEPTAQNAATGSVGRIIVNPAGVIVNPQVPAPRPSESINRQVIEIDAPVVPELGDLGRDDGDVGGDAIEVDADPANLQALGFEVAEFDPPVGEDGEGEARNVVYNITFRFAGDISDD